MKTHHLFLVFFLFVCAGVPRVFTLDAHWGSDEGRWLQRSAAFMTAVQTGAFDQTLQAYHPGVTTMWIGGIRSLFTNTENWLSLKNLALARWFICVAVSAGLVTAFFLLRRLFDLWPASAAWCCLILDPFFLAQTRRVHTDALATTFILITVLLFLLFCRSSREEKRGNGKYLVFSGITFGLACLSKSYSLILLPWLPISLWVFRDKATPLRELLFNAFVTAIFFFNWSLLTIFFLWPLFWHPLALLLGGFLLGGTLLLQRARQIGKHLPHAVSIATLLLTVCASYAVKTFWLVLEKVGWALTTPHEVDHLFFGKIVADPGGLFYPIALSIKSTPFVLPLAMGAIIYLWKHRQQVNTAKDFKVAYALGGVALLFTVCLSLTSKKFPRYLLPAFPMLDILAGMGLYYASKWIGTRFKKNRFRKITPAASVILVLLLTAVPVFARHPYYGTYYNPCWKVTDITNIITVGDASGLDLAGKYLNQKPNAVNTTVQVSAIGALFVRPYFQGKIYQLPPTHLIDNEPRPAVDYEVVYIRDSQINWVPQEGTRGGELEHVITLNGMDLVWIYRIRQDAN